MTKKKIKIADFNSEELRVIQKAMAMYSGFATNNARTDLKACLSILKKIL